MGQKIHPEGFRVGYIHDWKSNWFADKEFSDLLMQDLAIRDHIENKLAHAGLSDITIERRGEVAVDIHTARPGIVIGKSGSEVDALRKDLHKITGSPVKVNIREVKRPELDAKLVAQSIAEQLQNRVAFRRAMKRALTSAMRSGAKGVKVQISGRLGGAALDVFDQEPGIPAALAGLDNVVLTPHLAGSTRETWRDAFDLMCANLAAFLAGEPLPTPVR